MPRYFLQLFGIIALLGGCAPDVFIDFNFPSDEAFIRTETIQLIAVPYNPDSSSNPCAGLIEAAEVGGISNESFRTLAIPVCTLHSGSFTVTNVPRGPMAYIALGEGLDSANSRITVLTGCTLHDIYETVGPVEITLSPTSELLEQLMVGTAPSGCSVDMYCAGACS